MFSVLVLSSDCSNFDDNLNHTNTAVCYGFCMRMRFPLLVADSEIVFHMYHVRSEKNSSVNNFNKFKHMFTIFGTLSR